MMIDRITFHNEILPKHSVVVGVYEDGSLSPNAKKIDENLGGILVNTLQKLLFFSGETLFKTCSFVCYDNAKYNHVIAVGLGARDKEFSKLDLEKLGAKIQSASLSLDEEVSVAINGSDVNFQSDCASCFIALGALLKSWTFDKYKSKKDEKNILKIMCFLVPDSALSTTRFQELIHIADGAFLTRRVVSEPANVIYPESLANIAREELAEYNVETEILNPADMKKLGMNALLAVGQGSGHEPRLAIMRWNGAVNKSEKPFAFIGKGVTFDSGGISLKPGDNMHEMRYDMTGAGTVLGLMKAIALNRLPINAVGVMALVENMPSGTAQRPGDIVKSMSGQTIEVLNTDAEGRMVLADALWYTQDRFDPQIMIDLATLTGAIVVALGHEFAGLFSNCDELADQIYKSSIATGEKVWRMPMTKHFDKGIDSDIADMQNISRPNVRGGSITAAQFLKRFVNGKRWAHIDIAGVETTTSKDLFLCSPGATGFGVRLLYDFLSENYVAKKSEK